MTARATASALILALSGVLPARAEIETIVVTATPALSQPAIALYRTTERRLTPRGRAFVAREAAALQSETVRVEAVSTDAARTCPVAFAACGTRDAATLAFYTLAFAQWHPVDDWSGGDPRVARALEHGEPYLVRSDFDGFERAVTAALPPRARARFVAARARSDRIHHAMCDTLASLGMKDGCYPHPLH